MSPRAPGGSDEAASGRLGPGAVVGTVVRSQSGFYEVETAAGRLTAVLRGRFKRDRRREGLVALGDRVTLEMIEQPAGDAGPVAAVIRSRLDRETVLVRRAPGPKGAWSQDVVVANIDLLVPAFAVREPEPSLRMLDRFLALAEMDGIAAAIVFTKIDLGVAPAVAEAMRRYADIGYEVFGVSVATGAGVADLRARLAGRVSAVVGPSGVGKSSLLNAIEPGLDLGVGAVSEALGKGRHTTRVGVLHPLTGGGWVADTPGLREIGIWEVNPAELEWGFLEFQPLLHDCRFADCTHVHEPGCAVRAAVEAGAVWPERYASYRAMLEGG